MSVTREEAILLLKQYQGYEPMFPDRETLKHAFDLTDETVDTLLSALRPVSREQVEQVWRGCPECKPRCGLCVNMRAWDRRGKPYVCEQCVDYSNFESDQRFCEVCGCPMTDEAVDILLRRLEALHENP